MKIEWQKFWGGIILGFLFGAAAAYGVWVPIAEHSIHVVSDGWKNQIDLVLLERDTTVHNLEHELGACQQKMLPQAAPFPPAYPPLTNPMESAGRPIGCPAGKITLEAISGNRIGALRDLLACKQRQGASR